MMMETLIPDFSTKPEKATMTEILWLLSIHIRSNLAIRRMSLKQLRAMDQKQLDRLMDRIYAQLSNRGINPATVDEED